MKTIKKIYDRIIDFFCIIVMWMERPAVKFVSAGLTAVGVGAIVYFVLIGLLGGTLSFLAAAAVCVATVIVASAIFNWAE